MSRSVSSWYNRNHWDNRILSTLGCCMQERHAVLLRVGLQQRGLCERFEDMCEPQKLYEQCGLLHALCLFHG